MEPTWLRIIRYWCAQPGKTGPTFPFVFGAIRQPLGKIIEDEATAHRDFGSLVQAMKEYPYHNEYCAVHVCSVIRQPVITLQLDHRPRTGPWADLTKEFEGLHISFPELTPTQREPELWNRSRVAIVSGRYSFSRARNDFASFDADDMVLIDRALCGGGPGVP